MKITVTGASGFVGKHLIKHLSSEDFEIIAVSRSKSDYLSIFSNVQQVTVDLYKESEGIFAKLGSPDVLIHLAWGGLPNYTSIHHYEQELPGQYRFLKQMINEGLQNLLITGTCFEYGMRAGQLDESFEEQPGNCYAFAKVSLLRQLEFLKRQLPFNLIWARLFYMYGEGQSPKSLYSQLKQAVVNGDKKFNMSQGDQLRDFMTISEIVKNITQLACLKRDIGVVNICSGNPISIRGLVETWLRDNQWQVELNLGYYDYPNYEPMAFWGSRCKLDKVLSST